MQTLPSRDMHSRSGALHENLERAELADLNPCL